MSAFEGFILIQSENCSVINYIVENGSVHPCENPWHAEKYGTYRCSSIEFKHGSGAANGFGGGAQKGYVPDMCGISLD